jgi:hypothetical protein
MLLPDDADRLLGEALAHYETLGDQAGAAFARCALAYNAIFGAGDTERAFPLLREALAGAMTVGDRWVEAATCNGLTLSYLVLGDLDAASMWGERTLALSRTDGDIQGSATAHGLLGLTARRRGDATAALGHFREALANYERIGDRGNMCLSVEALAGLVASLGWPRPAAALFGAAAELRQRIGSPVAANELPVYEADLAAVRAALGDEAFAEAWTWGAAVPIPELVAGLPWTALSQPHHLIPGAHRPDEVTPARLIALHQPANRDEACQPGARQARGPIAHRRRRAVSRRLHCGRGRVAGPFFAPPGKGAAPIRVVT